MTTCRRFAAVVELVVLNHNAIEFGSPHVKMTSSSLMPPGYLPLQAVSSPLNRIVSSTGQGVYHSRLRTDIAAVFVARHAL